MSEKAKKIFIVEMLAIVLSLLPLLMQFVVPLVFGEELNEEMLEFIIGLVIFFVFPAVSILCGFFCALGGMDWISASLPGGIGFFLACITYMTSAVPILNALLFSAVYISLAMLPAYLTQRYKTRREERDKTLGRRL